MAKADHPRAASAARFWAVVAAVGVFAGIVGIAVIELLRLIERCAFGYGGAHFYDDVLAASPTHRALAVVAGGLVACAGWTWLRRTPSRAQDKPFRHATLDATFQVIVVAMGAALGREGAPRQVAAAAAHGIADRIGLSCEDRAILGAAAAGAGLAAVYNVPLAGGVFALEIVLRRWSLRAGIVAFACSGVAAVVSWTVLPNRPPYQLGSVPFSVSLLVFALVVGPALGFVARWFKLIAERARHAVPQGSTMLVRCLIAFAVLGCLSIFFPAILGNGKAASELALTAGVGAGTAGVLVVLRAAATLGCLWAGASGGLLTPSIAVGSLAGALLGAGWEHIWPTADLGGFALVAAAGFLAVTQRAPVCAVVLILEFTNPGASVVLPIVACVATAWTFGRGNLGQPPRDRHVPAHRRNGGVEAPHPKPRSEVLVGHGPA